jgi:hypothetical protein
LTGLICRSASSFLERHEARASGKSTHPPLEPGLGAEGGAGLEEDRTGQEVFLLLSESLDDGMKDEAL